MYIHGIRDFDFNGQNSLSFFIKTHHPNCED